MTGTVGTRGSGLATRPGLSESCLPSPDRARTARAPTPDEKGAALSVAAALTVCLAMVPARAADTVTFTDVTRASGITFLHVSSPDKRYILESMSGGVAIFDFDNDRLPDVYLVNAPTVASAKDPRSARSELWRNRGDGTFADVTDKAGVGYPGWGMGAVAADFDNDGWTDLYVTCYGANHLYRNNGDGTFTDVTAKAGVGDPRWSTGAAFADYDRDGWLDLFVANYADVRLDALPEFGKGKFCEFHGIPVQCGPRGLPGSGDSLYRNRGDGTFEDVSEKAGVADQSGRFGMGVSWSDFDDDGHPDLFVANDAGPNFLYRNTGGGSFADVSLQSGTALSEDGKEQGSMGVAIGDYNHSGGWSIFVTNFSDEYNALYRHDKAFQFTDASFASQTAKASIPYVGWGTHFFDYDNDGWLDLFVANDAGPNFLYRNTGRGAFADVSLQSGTALSEDGKEQGSMGVAIGDYNHSGGWSILVTNFSDEYNALYRHDKGFQFTDASFISQTAKASIPLVGWGTHFLDYDNDGWLDLFAANGHVYPQVERAGLTTKYAQRKLLYRNNRDGTFTEVMSGVSAISEPRVSRGSATGDLDNDGDLDIVINNLDGLPTVLRNDGGNRGGYLVVDLEARGGNRSATGAVVTVSAGDLVQRAERRRGDSYLSHSDARLHFGLGDRKTVDSMDVRWPDGAVQRFGEAPANRFIKIVQGSAPETVRTSPAR